MSLFFRDPLVRHLLYDDYERERALRPYTRPVSQPVRVHRLVDPSWALAPQSFDSALSDLQSVMDTVNEAIGHYQSGLTKDLVPGGIKMNRTEDGNVQVALDVSQYKPEEINVKICDDNLVVEAKTESSEDSSYHKSEFKRWIKLPQDVKHDAIKSTFTNDRKLVVDIPVNKPIETSRSRSIPIDVQKPAVEDKKSDQKGGDKKEQCELKK